MSKRLFTRPSITITSESLARGFWLRYFKTNPPANENQPDVAKYKKIALESDKEEEIRTAITEIANAGNLEALVEIFKYAKILELSEDSIPRSFAGKCALEALEGMMGGIDNSEILILIARETGKVTNRKTAVGKLAEKIREADDINLFAADDTELLTLVILYHEHDRKWQRAVRELELQHEEIFRKLEMESPPDYSTAFCLAAYAESPEIRLKALKYLPESHLAEIVILSLHIDTALAALERFNPEDHRTILVRIGEHARSERVRNIALDKWFFTSGFDPWPEEGDQDF